MKPPSLTLGIEEEYQIIDPRTRELRSYITEILDGDHLVLEEIKPLERYLGVKEDLADLAQQLLIFGTHVHIGIEDRDFLIDTMNVSRYLLPHVLCLSTSSPFWLGRNTGLKSYRSVIFSHFPRSGIPPRFKDWVEYEGMVETMVKTN